MSADADYPPHSGCAFCDEPSTCTVRPDWAYHGTSNPTHDVCREHVMDAVDAVRSIQAGWVKVGPVVSRGGSKL